MSSSMWDVYSSYSASDSPKEEAEQGQVRKFSMAGAWGDLSTAQSEMTTHIAADEPAPLVRSIFDLWKGPDAREAVAGSSLMDSGLIAPTEIVEEKPSQEAAISVFGVWGDYYNKPTVLDIEPDVVAAAPSSPSVLSGLWTSLRTSQKQTEADSSKPPKAKASAQPKVETSLFNAWNELYTGQALLEVEPGEKPQTVVTQDPILHPQQHPSGFRQWGSLLQAGISKRDSSHADAYVRLMILEGLPSMVIGQREKLLPALEALLKGQKHVPAVYRQVVSLLAQRSSDADHDEVLACARDYYYFWLGDLRYRPSGVVGESLTIRSLEALKASPFLNLLKRIRQESMAVAPPSLSIYLGQLHENGRSAAELGCRELLLTALLFFLQQEVFVPSSYRRAVDTLLLHIGLPDERANVVSLAREFFYYWIAFPPAAVRNEVFL